MRILIDGYNLMHARGLMAERFGPDGLRKVRHRFLLDLAASLGPFAAPGTTVVFDAADPPADRPERQGVKGLTVIFSVGDENADARIEALIAGHSHPKSLTVVSSDLRVRRAAERRRARSVTSDAFLSSLEDERRKPRVAKTPSIPEDLERKQAIASAGTEDWMAIFAEVANEPGIREALRASDFVPTDEEIARIEREVREEG